MCLLPFCCVHSSYKAVARPLGSHARTHSVFSRRSSLVGEGQAVFDKILGLLIEDIPSPIPISCYGKPGLPGRQVGNHNLITMLVGIMSLKSIKDKWHFRDWT